MPAEQAKAEVTIIIPTFNRRDILRVCLQRLTSQTHPHFEVLVLNDGSTDGTEELLAEVRASSPLRLRWLTQPNAGPARGRNLALAHVDTELSILIGDDILVSPAFVEQHLRLHRERPEKTVVGLGWTRWDTELQRLTPFMGWLENIQFDYARLLAGATPTWQHFYTSNLSFKTRLLREFPFDERFRKAAFEDVELGYRLARAHQLELIFLKKASATHVHPTTLTGAARRMYTVGYSEHQIHEYWPDTLPPKSSWWKDAIKSGLSSNPRALQALTRLVERIQGDRRPSQLAWTLLLAHRKRGYLDCAKGS